MKYIKTFEYDINTNSMYWLVPTDDRFENSLKQIECPDEKIELFLTNNEIKKYDYIFIDYSYDNWGWNDYHGKMLDEYYENRNYKFMGTINIDYNDIDFAVNKFNL